MTDTSVLDGLLARVEKATGPDRELDRDLSKAIVGVSSLTPLTARVDAALALVGVLKGACWRIDKHSPKLTEAHGAPYWASCGLPGEQESAFAATAPLAILAALLRALLSQKQTVEA